MGRQQVVAAQLVVLVGRLGGGAGDPAQPRPPPPAGVLPAGRGGRPPQPADPAGTGEVRVGQERLDTTDNLVLAAWAEIRNLIVLRLVKKFEGNFPNFRIL